VEKKAFSSIQNIPESPAVDWPMEEQRKKLAKLIAVAKKRARSRALAFCRKKQNLSNRKKESHRLCLS